MLRQPLDVSEPLAAAGRLEILIDRAWAIGRAYCLAGGRVRCGALVSCCRYRTDECVNRDGVGDSSSRGRNVDAKR